MVTESAAHEIEQRPEPVSRPKILADGVMGMLLFVFAEIMMFAGLISAHRIVRSQVAGEMYNGSITKKITFEKNTLAIVSPDVGGVVRARAFAKRINASLVIIDKRREKAGESEVMNIIGDVQNRTCIIIDDIVDTANTLCEAALALKKHGAKKIVAYATHPIFSGDAINSINNSELDEIVITDTITLEENAKNTKKIRQLSVAELLAETIRRISHEDSVSSLFME